VQYWKNKQGIIRGVTYDGYIFILEVRPRIENLVGRFAQNGIRVPKSGRWIVIPGHLIDDDHVKEIGKLKSVLPTLFIGTRRDSPIIQNR